MPEPNSTLPPAATTKGTIATDLMPAPQGGVQPASSEQIPQPRNQKGTAGLQQLWGNSLPYRGWKCIFQKSRPNPLPRAPPCLGRQQRRLGCVCSLGIAIRWLAPMIRQKSSRRTLGGHFLPLHPFPASQGPNQ